MQPLLSGSPRNGLRALALGSWLAALTLAAPGLAAAQADGPPEVTPAAVAVAEEPSPTQLHAFVSQGVIKTTDNNYLAQSERGSFEMAEVGINVTRVLTDRLRVGLQLFARDLGPLGNYGAKFDWFYLDYRLTDWLGVRAGRVKLPFGLYNEINDVDAARVPILLPQAVYSTRNRDFLLAQTGLELYGYLALGAGGGLDYRLYGGTVFVELSESAFVAPTDVQVPYIFGGRVMWETPLDGLRVGGSVQALRLDFNGLLAPAPGAPRVPVVARLPVVLWAASAEYALQDLLLATEYSRWRVEVESMTMGYESRVRYQERCYVMGSYRVAPWFTPGAYISAFYPNVDVREGRQSYQHDFAATLRFDVNSHWLVKLEGHFMHGTADLDSTLNGGAPLATLSENWGLFLAKMTAYF
jgi:hypothetical protein